MNLKKINPNLQKALQENGLTEANELQQETYSAFKSGIDAVIQAPANSGKTTTIALHTIQKLEKAIGESTRALILVTDKEKVLQLLELFEKLAAYTDLRFFGVHDKGDMDYDKNQISLGCDVLIGTPNKINAMFSSAGFNLNTVKLFIVDDADEMMRSRMDAILLRLYNSIEKTQRVFFCNTITEKVEILADKIMPEPLFFETEEE